MRRKPEFSSVDAVLCLVLAARIHRKDAAVRITAKRLLGIIPKEDRRGVSRFITAKRPLESVELLLEFWFQQHVANNQTDKDTHAH